MAHRRITNPWRAVSYGHNHTPFRTTVACARHIWEQKPGIDMKTLAKKAKCTPALAYYATKELRQNYLLQKNFPKRKLTQPTWRPATYGSRKFSNRSEKVRFYLSHPKLSQLTQTEIARECGVSSPRVSQIAAEKK